MKKFMRDILGVTLLEIMLVLAIAAMIIIISVRFYQSATVSQQVNGAMQFIQGVTAAADSLAQGTGSYQDVNAADITTLMPGGSMNSPWGSVSTWAAASPTSFTITFTTPPGNQVCLVLTTRLQGNNKYSIDGTCSVVTYDNAA